jgi:hypothetical protein
VSATDLTLHGWEWLRAAVGLGVFLLPGMAAADRWLKGVPLRFGWAPVLSFTLMALSAILLDFVGGVAVRTSTTVGLAIALAAAIARPRIVSWWRARGAPRTAQRSPRRLLWGPAWGLVAVLPFLFVAHSLPHLDGPAPASAVEFPQLFLQRAQDAATGEDNPYPVHVDEHLHMAFMAEIDRTGEVEADHPYTGEETTSPAFTVAGLRSERGWQVAVVQFHQATGVPFPVLAHFLPALWAAYLGFCMWLLLRPAPGALAAAAFTALLPTTLRFLGVGFLVPSAFALPWILAVMAVAHRGEGPGRLIALALLITGGFFMHIVPGTVALAAGLLTAVLRPGGWQERLGLVGALLLPLLWIWPSMKEDVRVAVTLLNGLPFQPTIFSSIGWALLGASAAGAGAAWLRLQEATVPHRALSILAIIAMASLAWSIDAHHSNDATYGRLIPILFLCVAALAGLGFGASLGALAGWVLQNWPAARLVATAIAVTAATLVAVAHPLQQHMQEPYYRVFEDGSWATLEHFAATPAGPGDVFLSHPWQAPLYSAATGASPWTYLLPGAPPVQGDDFVYYQSSEGANATWLKERGIQYVVGLQAPKAPHVQLAPQVFLLTDE